MVRAMILIEMCVRALKAGARDDVNVNARVQ